MKRVLCSEATRVVAGLSALFLLALAPSLLAWAQGMWPFEDDAVALFAPWREWARASLQNGILPLWNPHLFCGMPFLSNGQTAVLYPPNVLYWLLPIRAALFWDALLHGVLLGAGGYALARTLNRSRHASWLCATCLLLGNGVAAHLYAGHMTWHAARAWLPLILWAMIGFLQKGEIRYALALAVCFALQVHSGYPPYVLWSVAWCFVFAFAWLIARQKEIPAHGLWRPALLGGVLLVLLSASLVLPLRETSRLGAHGVALPFEHAVIPSSTWAGWVRLALPNFFGGNRVAQWSVHKFPHEEAAYIGLLPLALALGAPLLLRRFELSTTYFNARRFVGVLWLLLPVSLILALGEHTPVYRFLFDTLPPLRMFRAPSRWFEIWYFAACVLAAFGFDALLQSSLALKRWSAAFTIFALLLLALALLIGLSPSTFSLWSETAQWNKTDLQASSADRLAYAEYLRLTALQSVAGASAFAIALVFFLKRLANAEAPKEIAPRPINWKRGLLALIAADVLLVFWSSARFAPDAPPHRPWPKNAAASFQSGDRWSTAFTDEAFSYGLDQGLPQNIDIVGGYDALAAKDFFDLASAIEKKSLWSSQYQAQRFDSLWRVLGVTHVLASSDSPLLPKMANLKARQLVTFGSGEHALQLWRLPEAWPRAYFAQRVLTEPRESQLKRLGEIAADKNFTAVALINPYTFSGFAPGVNRARVLRRRREANRVLMEVQTDPARFGPQLLVYGESLAPGWRAWVDGKPARLAHANFLFRGVAVTAGASQVALVYDSQTFRVGVFLSLCGLALLAGVLTGTITSAASSRRAHRPKAATSR